VVGPRGGRRSRGGGTRGIPDSAASHGPQPHTDAAAPLASSPALSIRADYTRGSAAGKLFRVISCLPRCAVVRAGGSSHLVPGGITGARANTTARHTRCTVALTRCTVALTRCTVALIRATSTCGRIQLCEHVVWGAPRCTANRARLAGRTSRKPRGTGHTGFTTGTLCQQLRDAWQQQLYGVAQQLRACRRQPCGRFRKPPGAKPDHPGSCSHPAGSGCFSIPVRADTSGRTGRTLIQPA
jgi:hypothetical protein